MTKRQRRMFVVAMLILGVGGAVALTLNAFRDNLLYFISPSEVVAGKAPAERSFRLGGMVEEGSVKRDSEGLRVRFVLTDFAKEVPVQYDGILPDLFREGQGIVAKGHLNAQGVFVATEVLAKHDEKYMPPEVAASLKRAQSDTTSPVQGKP